MAGKYTKEQREKLVNEVRGILSKELKSLGKQLEKIDIHDDIELRELAGKMKDACGSIHSIAHTLIIDSSVTN